MFGSTDTAARGPLFHEPRKKCGSQKTPKSLGMFWEYYLRATLLVRLTPLGLRCSKGHTISRVCGTVTGASHLPPKNERDMHDRQDTAGDSGVNISLVALDYSKQVDE
jgi:hypothetical protein